MKPVNIHDAKTHFSRLIERVVAGEEIIIARNGKPVAKLVSIPQNLTPRVMGSMRGQIWIADDFDDPLPPELQKYFDGEE